MRLLSIEINGFKSFGKKSVLNFTDPVTAVVGPNGSGKSNVVEAFRFVLGEQSMKSMRGKSGADLIFRGTNSKLSRASVSITFDNSDNIFKFQNNNDSTVSAPVLFDKITFTREVFADGTSKYLLNNTEIRLKQMVELLSSVNIGTSSHHIISQGEADGILRASTKERREIIEDALGLKIYHFRIKESENKLAKAQDTLGDVQALRRELVPHLKFLQKQVEKIEKGRVIRSELEGVWKQYLANEKDFLSKEDTRITESENFIKNQLSQGQEILKLLPEEVQNVDSASSERFELQKTLREISDNRRSIESKISRLQGVIDAHRNLLQNQSENTKKEKISFEEEEYSLILSDIQNVLNKIKATNNFEEIKFLVSEFESILVKLNNKKNKEFANEDNSFIRDTIRDTALEMESLEKELKNIIQKESELQERMIGLEKLKDEAILQNQENTRKRYEVISAIKQSESELQILNVSKNAFLERKEYFDNELKEAGFIFGPVFIRELQEIEIIPELNIQEARRNIDRLKIRLDEHSGIGNEVLVEYESTKERDQFLAREVADIEASIRNLEALIADLKKTLDNKFTEGVKVINERFSEFFKIMFGGGNAFLSVIVEKKKRRKNDEVLSDIDEEEIDESDDRFFERGVEIHVNLPEKKVKDLQMLSGGERSLVSIAFLFAMSQVNPPPFLVLDETDAALDEANSRRYGDMIERLSEYSQLIVVTHNRETMSRATILYGVTMASDGASRLLSIKFDEAVKVAK